MPGQNPYSPYLPANNESLFTTKQQDSGSNLSTILGLGGGALGLMLGGLGGAKAGMTLGSGIGQLVGGDTGKQKMQGFQSTMSGLGGLNSEWYKQDAAKKAAASMMNVGS